MACVANTLMTTITIAYIVIAYRVMAYVVMVCISMAYMLIACIEKKSEKQTQPRPPVCPIPKRPLCHKMLEPEAYPPTHLPRHTGTLWRSCPLVPGVRRHIQVPGPIPQPPVPPKHPIEPPYAPSPQGWQNRRAETYVSLLPPRIARPSSTCHKAKKNKARTQRHSPSHTSDRSPKGLCVTKCSNPRPVLPQNTHFCRWDIVMADIDMAYIVMAYIGMAYAVMAYIVMAYRAMAYIGSPIQLWLI